MEPQTPTQPAAPRAARTDFLRVFFEAVRTHIVLLIVAILVMTSIVVSAVVAAKMATQALAIELKQLRDDNAEAQRHNEKRMKDLIDSVQEIEINTPPTNDKLFTILSKGLGVNEDVIRTGQVGTTPIAAFATDLTTAQQVDAYTQEIVITNRDDATSPTQNLCFRTIAWSGVTTCNTLCSTSGYTCPAPGGAGASTDGVVTPKGSSWNRRFDGTSCICIVASAASTEYQTERVLR